METFVRFNSLFVYAKIRLTLMRLHIAKEFDCVHLYHPHAVVVISTHTLCSCPSSIVVLTFATFHPIFLQYFSIIQNVAEYTTFSEREWMEM